MVVMVWHKAALPM